jgi:hypothetical protein
MVLRVLDALEAAGEVGPIMLSGPHQSAIEQAPELHDRVMSGKVQWVESEATPSLSTYRVLQGLARDVPAFVTTADHALLSPQMADFFCAEARATGCDIVAAVARHEQVAGTYPESRRTVIRLKDGGFCGCNMFAFLTFGARAAADYWRRVEEQRKKSFRVISTLGFMAVLRYFTGQLTLTECLQRLSKRLALTAGAVVMPFPEAAVDVDKVSDLRLAEAIIGQRSHEGGGKAS